MTAALAPVEAARLAELETVIERGRQTFVDVGNALLEIRDSRLYRDTHNTFEAYCQERWGFNRHRASQLITAAEVVTTVTSGGLGAPTNERQARELVPLLREDDQQVADVWRELREEHGDDLTAATIRAAVGRRLTTAELLVQSNQNEWYTPSAYVEAARRVLGGIDLDPASSESANQTIRAASFYTEADDGLSKPWGGRVWLNPPYGGLAGQFTARLLAEHRTGNVSAAVLLVNSNSTDTAWFQPLWDHVLCFTNHRVNFASPSREKPTGSTHGSVFAYLGSRPEVFAEEFSQYGAVVSRFETDAHHYEVAA